MNNQDAFERILASLYDAMLDETRWPATSALIDEACGITGNGLMVAEGPKDDVRAVFVGLYSRGQRREDLEREYLENYHSIDERVPRFRQLRVSRLVHINDLYTVEELKTSPTYNELLPRAGMQDSLNVRLAGLDGSHIGSGGLPHHRCHFRPSRQGSMGRERPSQGMARQCTSACPAVPIREAKKGGRSRPPPNSPIGTAKQRGEL